MYARLCIYRNTTTYNETRVTKVALSAGIGRFHSNSELQRARPSVDYRLESFFFLFRRVFPLCNTRGRSFFVFVKTNGRRYGRHFVIFDRCTACASVPLRWVISKHSFPTNREQERGEKVVRVGRRREDRRGSGVNTRKFVRVLVTFWWDVVAVRAPTRPVFEFIYVRAFYCRNYELLLLGAREDRPNNYYYVVPARVAENNG